MLFVGWNRGGWKRWSHKTPFRMVWKYYLPSIVPQPVSLLFEEIIYQGSLKGLFGLHAHSDVGLSQEIAKKLPISANCSGEIWCGGLESTSNWIKTIRLISYPADMWKLLKSLFRSLPHLSSCPFHQYCLMVQQSSRLFWHFTLLILKYVFNELYFHDKSWWMHSFSISWSNFFLNFSCVLDIMCIETFWSCQYSLMWKISVLRCLTL